MFWVTVTNKMRITLSSYVPGITKKAFSEELSLPQRFSAMRCVFDLRRVLNDSYIVCSIWRGDKIRFLQVSVNICLSNCNMQGESLIKHFGLYDRPPSNTTHLSSAVNRRAREIHDLPPSGVDVQSKPIWKKFGMHVVKLKQWSV